MSEQGEKQRGEARRGETRHDGAEQKPEDRPRGDQQRDGGGKADERAKSGALKGVIVRVIIGVIALVGAAMFMIDWNAIVWEANRRGTDDAQLRGNPTQLSARVAGYVTEVAVTDYQAVRRGDLLYQIEQDDYQARVDSAQADVDSARAAVAEAEAQVAVQQAQVGSAVATAQEAQANFEQARLERERQAALLGTESALPRAYEAADAQAQRLKAQFNGDQDAVAAQQAQVKILQAQLDQAHATLHQREAALNQAKINLGYTRIIAPDDGTVGQRLAFKGQYLSPGTQVITLVPLNQVWAVANYREEQVKGMRVGQPASVRVDAYPGVVLHGRVESFEPTSQANESPTPPDRAVGSFTFIEQRIPVKITLDALGDARGASGRPLEGRLLPGLSVETVVDVTAAPGTRANP
jgi:membrane fusion protein (multidrug efflux system)